MADPIVVNATPARSEDSSHGMWFFLGILALIAFAVLAFYYVVPVLRDATAPAAPSISVPEQIDVNVNQPK